MDLDPIKSDIKFLCEHIYPATGCELAVRKWTDINCDDYQAAIVLALLLFNPARGAIPKPLYLRDNPAYQVGLAIILNSSLSSVLEFNESQNCLRVRDSISRDTMEELARVYIEYSGPAIE